jgi:hypothetical protein
VRVVSWCGASIAALHFWFCSGPRRHKINCPRGDTRRTPGHPRHHIPPPVTMLASFRSPAVPDAEIGRDRDKSSPLQPSGVGSRCGRTSGCRLPARPGKMEENFEGHWSLLTIGALASMSQQLGVGSRGCAAVRAPEKRTERTHSVVGDGEVCTLCTLFVGPRCE